MQTYQNFPSKSLQQIITRATIYAIGSIKLWQLAAESYADKDDTKLMPRLNIYVAKTHMCHTQI